MCCDVPGGSVVCCAVARVNSVYLWRAVLGFNVVVCLSVYITVVS